MKGGIFATAARCGASDHIAFIYEKATAGVPVSAIAAMLGSSVSDVAALAPPVAPRASYGQWQAKPEPEPEPEPTRIPRRVQRIIEGVAGAYGMTVDDLIGPRRHKRFIAPRHEAYWQVRDQTAYSFPQIGQFFGGRDHTTIMLGARRHAERLGGAI